MSYYGSGVIWSDMNKKKCSWPIIFLVTNSVRMKAKSWTVCCPEFLYIVHICIRFNIAIFTNNVWFGFTSLFRLTQTAKIAGNYFKAMEFKTCHLILIVLRVCQRRAEQELNKKTAFKLNYFSSLHFSLYKKPGAHTYINMKNQTRFAYSSQF